MRFGKLGICSASDKDSMMEVILVPVFISRDLCYIVLNFGAIFLLHLEGNKLQSVLLIKQYLIRPRILILCRFAALVKQTRIKSAQGKTVYSNQTDILHGRIHNYVATILKENDEDGRFSERENSIAEVAQEPPLDLKKVVDNDFLPPGERHYLDVTLTQA